jgi:hypothetical protein
VIATEVAMAQGTALVPCARGVGVPMLQLAKVEQFTPFKRRGH